MDCDCDIKQQINVESNQNISLVFSSVKMRVTFFIILTLQTFHV